MINLQRIAGHRLETIPYRWAVVDELFSDTDAVNLATSFPCDHFKLVAGYGGEKDYEYEARELIGMGADRISHAVELSEFWRTLAKDFLSPNYRETISSLSGCDLSDALLEVNVFHYGPGASLGAHADLPEKIVTHVLYFNRSWNTADGGCLTILGSASPANIVATVPPVVGTSAVLVRSDNSWHAVSPVVPDCQLSRRSLTATFYRPGSVSTMWPPNEEPALHIHNARDLQIQASAPTGFWRRWRNRFASSR
jgi:SM-20-related protein